MHTFVCIVARKKTSRISSSLLSNNHHHHHHNSYSVRRGLSLHSSAVVFSSDARGERYPFALSNGRVDIVPRVCVQDSFFPRNSSIRSLHSNSTNHQLDYFRYNQQRVKIRSEVSLSRECRKISVASLLTRRVESLIICISSHVSGRMWGSYF